MNPIVQNSDKRIRNFLDAVMKQNLYAFHRILIYKQIYKKSVGIFENSEDFRIAKRFFSYFFYNNITWKRSESHL